MKRPILLALVAFTLSMGIKPSLQVEPQSDPEIHYNLYCASCHGRRLESFKSRVWTVGKNPASINTVIRQGSADKAMPAFAQLLTEDQTTALATFILQQSQLPIENESGDELYSSAEFKMAAEVIFTEAQVPWSITPLPDSSLLITDRDGQLFCRKQDGKTEAISGLPMVHNKGQGGLLDLCLHPDFKNNHQIYFSYSKPVESEGKKMSTTAVCRAILKGQRLEEVTEIFEAKPYFSTSHHYGSRLAFDNDGFLYISVGDRGKENENPQNLLSDCGKVHRLNPDGSIPTDNPFYNQANANKSIFTYGHRNPQGMAFNVAQDRIWVNEHGPRGGDEVNILNAGANYGWPLTCYGINYDGTTITNDKTKEGISNPEVVWVPSIAPCDALFVSSNLYYPWKGDYLVPSMSFGYLNRCIVKENKVVNQEKLLEDIGRMRSIAEGADGFIYLGLENPGRVIRLRPLW